MERIVKLKLNRVDQKFFFWTRNQKNCLYSRKSALLVCDVGGGVLNNWKSTALIPCSQILLWPNCKRSRNFKKRVAEKRSHLWFQELATFSGLSLEEQWKKCAPSFVFYVRETERDEFEHAFCSSSNYRWNTQLMSF